MKLPFPIFLGALLLISGCKSSTEPPGNKLGPSITVISNWSPSLDGGGRWFNGADTGVWYDATLSFTLDNSSGSTKDISYKLEIGQYKNGKFQQGSGELFYDGDSIISGTYKVGTSTTLELTPTIGVGRKNTKDWTYPYGYRLTLTDIATNDTYVTEGPFDGSKPENRFQGIIYTLETSSDSLGLIDGPDDGDWQANKNPYMRADPCYPNPTVGRNITTRFDIQNNDSVVVTVNKTKRSVIKKIVSEIRDAGTWEYQIFMDSITSGQYRLYYHFVDSSRVFNSHGDVKFIIY
ncbi:MAG: hypothetical protein ACHQM6_05115 [Candidatus Kapaibacterium sp.]